MGLWKQPGLHVNVRFAVYGCRVRFGRIVRRVIIETFKQSILLEGFECSDEEVNLVWWFSHLTKEGLDAEIDHEWDKVMEHFEEHFEL